MTPLILATLILSSTFCMTAGALEPRLTTLIAEQQVALWSCQDQLGVARSPVRTSPWALPRSPRVRARVLNKWTLLRKECAAELAEVRRQWDWKSWLPDHGRRLAICETSMRWDFVGSSSDGHFVSAFAISVSVYNKDAARMGVRGWWDKPYPPSPWEQWQAARGHYRIFGDGWTGHCHGIMRG